MNILKYVLGFLADKMNASVQYYKAEEYKKKIVGTDYRLGLVNCRYPENIEIGKGTYINGGNLHASPNGKIVIGENCLISYNFFARTDVHNYIKKDILINEQGNTEKSIIIGNDVWIGYDVKIMGGVKIGNGCVIAAGAVVTKDTEAYCMYAGVPAVRIKHRI